MKKIKVGVVGATGVVGREMIDMLEQRDFPIESLRLLSSQRSAGKKLQTRNGEITVELLGPDSSKGLDLALFSAGAAASKTFAPMFAAEGCFVVDNSSAWRMDPDIPLVVPEVNPDALQPGKKIIANPNCSTIQMVVVLKPIYDAAGIQRVIVSTYQSVSGAGKAGIVDLENQTHAWASDESPPEPEKFPHPIAFNAIPHIDVFLDNAYTKEEMKMTDETRKIMGDERIALSATCVRIPVFRAHSEAVWIETRQKLDPVEARNILSAAPGVEVIDDTEHNRYPLPVDAAGEQRTYVGRIREDISSEKGLVLWVVSDNLLKGAALNAVEIAEALVAKNYV